MSSNLLQQLFRTQAQSVLRELSAILAGEARFPRTWEDFFLQVHDLKAQALVANLKECAQNIHQLEDELWLQQNSLAALNEAYKKLAGWFSNEDTNDRPLFLKEVLELITAQATELGKELGKTIDIRMTTGSLGATELFPAALYPCLIHVIHNALTHGVDTNGMMWIHAYRINSNLVVEVEDDGGARNIQNGPMTILSGRGVGLKSIRRAMKENKGEFTLESSERGGTRAKLALELPGELNKVS